MLSSPVMTKPKMLDHIVVRNRKSCPYTVLDISPDRGGISTLAQIVRQNISRARSPLRILAFTPVLTKMGESFDILLPILATNCKLSMYSLHYTICGPRIGIGFHQLSCGEQCAHAVVQKLPRPILVEVKCEYKTRI